MFIYKIKPTKLIAENCFSKNYCPKYISINSKKKITKNGLLEEAKKYYKNHYGILIEDVEIKTQKITLPILLSRVRQFFTNEINRRGELYDNFKLWMDENKNEFGRKLTLLQAKDVYVKYLMRRLKDSLEKSDENSFASEFDFICDKIKSLKISPERKAERLEEKLGNPFGFDEIYDWEPVLFAFGRLGFDLNLFRNMNISDGQKLVLAYHVIGADKELTYDEIERLVF